jgi:2-oxoglutarate dehydrogenase E1 component
MVVANCTTPANFFHLLRRQMAWPFRKPLVVMSPKSLLRHPLVKSKLIELTSGKFEEVLVDDFGIMPSAVKRVLMCSGKVYFDLLQGLNDSGRKDIVLVRLEQVYPLPDVKLNALYAKYPKAEFCWVQEEPKNMGAYTFLLRMEENKRLRLISRKASASPATGYAQKHAEEQAQIVAEAVGAEPSKTPSDDKVMETAA